MGRRKPTPAIMKIQSPDEHPLWLWTNKGPSWTGRLETIGAI